MKCEQATRQLRKDFINKVHRHATDPYYAHLLGCPSCRLQQEYLQQMYTLFQDVPKARLPDAFVSELQVYFSENISSKKQNKKRRIGFFLWPAAVVCCLLAVFFYLQQTGKMSDVQAKIADISSELKLKVSHWIDLASERSEEIGQVATEKLNYAKEAVIQTVTGKAPHPSEGNFDKISKNLNQSGNAKLNPKDIAHKNSVQGLKKNNALFDKSPGENVVDTEMLDAGAEELDQLLAQQKQQKQFVNDKIADTAEKLLDAKDQDLVASETEKDELPETNVKNENEDEATAPELAEMPPVDDSQQAIPQIENEDTELESCAFATKFNGYNAVDFGESQMMSVAPEMPEGTSPEDFILSTARRYYRLNWGKQEMGVMGGVVLSPSIPTNTTMAIDVVTEAPKTDVLTELKNQFALSPENQGGSMQLTLDQSHDMDDVKLQQLIQELDSEDLTNQSAVETFASDDLKTEPVLNPDEVEQVLDKYHLQYCAEDPEILSDRQYSFNE